jgi:hypothetical protein
MRVRQEGEKRVGMLVTDIVQLHCMSVSLQTMNPRMIQNSGTGIITWNSEFGLRREAAVPRPDKIGQETNPPQWGASQYQSFRSASGEAEKHPPPDQVQYEPLSSPLLEAG